MILTLDFVFVHMPKTGGSFVRKLFRDHAPKSWEMREIEDHITAENTPASHAHLPKFGFVRNPYPWYVSWHNYHLDRLRSGELSLEHFFSRHSHLGELSFKATMLNIRSADEVVKSGTGFYTMYLQRHFGPNGSLVEVHKTETLRPDLLGFLQGHARELPQAMATAIAEDPRVNVSSKGHYSDNYDDELRQLVAEGDQEVLRRFGYQFQGPR